MRRISGYLSLSLLLLAGCLYGFSGGGFPPEIKTVAVLPFENLTADPSLTDEVYRAVREALEGRLGLRQSGESSADAVVSGTITRYEPDLPSQVQQGLNNRADVTKRRLQISLTVRIENRHTGQALWEQQNMMVTAEYDANQEQEGRRDAIKRITANIVDGAQSQW